MPRRLRVEVGADLRELLLRGGDLRLGRARRNGGPLLGCGLGRRFGRAYAFFMRRSERRELAFVRLGRDLHRRLGVLGRGLGLRELAFMSLGELPHLLLGVGRERRVRVHRGVLGVLPCFPMVLGHGRGGRLELPDPVRRLLKLLVELADPLTRRDALGGRALRRGAQLRLGGRSGRDGGLRRGRLLLELRVLGK